MSTFFISRKLVTSSWIDWRLAFRTKTKATSHGGVILAEAICVAAATRGSFRTRQFRAVRKNDHTLRRSRFNWLNGASGCTEFHASKRCLIRFLVLEIPPSRLNVAA